MHSGYCAAPIAPSHNEDTVHPLMRGSSLTGAGRNRADAASQDCWRTRPVECYSKSLDLSQKPIDI
jgi:hypothetical protein